MATTTTWTKLTTKARNTERGERHVEVVLRWGGDVVEVRRLAGAERLSVGRLPSDDLFVPLELVPSVDVLTRDEASGAWRLVTAPGMRGTIRRGAQTIDVSPDIGATAILDDDTSAVLVAGAFTLEIGKSERSRMTALAPIFDVLWANTATVSLFAMAAFVAVFTLLPTSVAKDAADLAVSPSRLSTIVMHMQAASQSRADASSSPSPSPVAAREQQQRHARAAQQKPPRAAASQQRPSDADVVNGKLAALFGGEQGLATLVGDSAGDRMADLLGGIDGKRTASADAGRLGLVGAGPGGDAAGENTVGIGRVGTVGKGNERWDYGEAGGFIGKKEDHVIVMDALPPRITGSLDKEIIRRVVQAHVDQVRACYERELQRAPGLEGKIGMVWDIGASGHVRSTRVETSSGNRALDGCIAAHVRTWVFPAPKGGGDVVVHYPFVVKRG